LQAFAFNRGETADAGRENPERLCSERWRVVVVVDGVLGGVEAHEPPALPVVVVRATVSKARERCDGSVRLRFSARLRMPRAARPDSEYLSGTFCGSSRISVSDGSQDEHPASSLRHSEETAVENPPCQAIPEVGQRSKHDSEVPTAVATEQSGYVLDEKPSGSKRLSDSGELMEEAGAFACESGSSSGDGDVLAGETAADKINVAVRGPCPAASSVGDVSVSSHRSQSVGSWAFCDFTNVLVDRDSRPMLREHPSSPSVRLTEEHVSKPSSVESEVEPADP